MYLVFVLGLSGFLAYIGRKNLLPLSDSYGASLARARKIATRLEQQAWLRNGQTELAEQVLGQLTLNLLGRNILQFCAQYLGSAVAALYVREEHGGLKRVASYGFSVNRKQREQRSLQRRGHRRPGGPAGPPDSPGRCAGGLLQGQLRPGEGSTAQRAGGADQR